MGQALALARRGLGNVWPNPAVGCLIVEGGRVLGRGWTLPGGRPHAETEALAAAGPAARGATAYVSLEPCAHHGETGPCADALIAAGVARVVVAARDPDPRVSGAGIVRLRDAGVAVSEDVCRAEAERLNAGFIRRIVDGRPLLTLKLATSLDGRIATSSGESQWITGAAARARAHLLRAQHDAVLIGSGTALADDPALTCRLPGWTGRQPIRLVLDARLRLPADGALAAGARQVSVWVVTVAGQDGAALRAAGVELIEVAAGADGGVDPAAALAALGARGLTRVLVEGGGRLAAALLRAGLVDELRWFRAPSLIGADGLPGIGELGVADLAQQLEFRRVAVEPVGDDLLESYVRRAL